MVIFVGVAEDVATANGPGGTTLHGYTLRGVRIDPSGRRTPWVGFVQHDQALLVVFRLVRCRVEVEGGELIHEGVLAEDLFELPR